MEGQGHQVAPVDHFTRQAARTDWDVDETGGVHAASGGGDGQARGTTDDLSTEQPDAATRGQARGCDPVDGWQGPGGDGVAVPARHF